MRGLRHWPKGLRLRDDGNYELQLHEHRKDNSTRGRLGHSSPSS
jgi:hypothetical protein